MVKPNEIDLSDETLQKCSQEHYLQLCNWGQERRTINWATLHKSSTDKKNEKSSLFPQLVAVREL
jgi:hypothetical protein